LINTKGVEILPCKYAEIRIGYKYVVVTDAAGKVGYFSTATNKFVMPVQEGLPGDDKDHLFPRTPTSIMTTRAMWSVVC